MAGLRNICRALGGMKVTVDGRSIDYVWDYAADAPVDSKQMPVGSERWKRSEKAKFSTRPALNAKQPE